MCTTIKLQDGTIIETVSEFETHFQTDTEYRESSVVKGSDCLCRVNIDDYFEDFSELGYTYDIVKMEWQEPPFDISEHSEAWSGGIADNH